VKLDDMFGRKMTDYDPIGEESAKVIARRLFESIDPAAAQVASATYHALYQRVSSEHPGSIPHSAIAPEYAKRIVECSPFHPRLLDTAQNRDQLRSKAYEAGLILIGCGDRTIRFRPPLNLRTEEVDEGVTIIRKALKELEVGE